MSKVIFAKEEDRFFRVLPDELKKVFSAGESIAVKLHMGEDSNTAHLQPEFVKKVVDILRNIGTIPFLFDSPVTYNSRRATPEGYLELAAEKGFSESKMGCRIVVSEESVNVKGEKIRYGVCEALVKADGVLVLAHLKGHVCSGFGGAIKQLGMGALDIRSKQSIHDGGRPVYTGGCIMCGECAKGCPLGNIRYVKGSPRFDNSKCYGCSDCVYACKQGAIKPRVDFFDVLLAEAATLALKNFKKAYFVSVLKNITKECDCTPQSEIVANDIGYLMSSDMVAIDKAAFDMINEQAGKDLFKEVHKKSPLKHIRRAEKFGGGSASYALVRK